MNDTEGQKELGFDRVRGSIREVALDDIEPTDNPTDSDASLNNAVDALGLVSTPLIQASEHERWAFDIVDGVRRVHAARDAGTTTMHAYVLPPDVDAEADALTAIMNIVRRPSPLREAEALSDLIQAGYTKESLSRMGIDRKTLNKRLRLARAPDRIKEGVREGEIAEGTAEQVANMSRALQERCVAFYVEEGKLRRKDVKEIRQRTRDEEAEGFSDDLFGEETGADRVSQSPENRSDPEPDPTPTDSETTGEAEGMGSEGGKTNDPDPSVSRDTHQERIVEAILNAWEDGFRDDGIVGDAIAEAEFKHNM